MIELVGQVGPQTVSDGSKVLLRQGKGAELDISQFMSRYYEANYRGKTFTTGVAAATPTGYTGGAGGTPLLSLYNPPKSQVNLVIKMILASIEVSASAAGTDSIRLYGGPSVQITGTQTVGTPISASTLTAAGSQAQCFNNTANTSSTALSYLCTIGFYYWATAAAAFAGDFIWEPSGLLLIPPGCQIALGSKVALTSEILDASMFWDEIPV